MNQDRWDHRGYKMARGRSRGPAKNITERSRPGFGDTEPRASYGYMRSDAETLNDRETKPSSRDVRSRADPPNRTAPAVDSPPRNHGQGDAVSRSGRGKDGRRVRASAQVYVPRARRQQTESADATQTPSQSDHPNNGHVTTPTNSTSLQRGNASRSAQNRSSESTRKHKKRKSFEDDDVIDDDRSCDVATTGHDLDAARGRLSYDDESLSYNSDSITMTSAFSQENLHGYLYEYELQNQTTTSGGDTTSTVTLTSTNTHSHSPPEGDTDLSNTHPSPDTRVAMVTDSSEQCARENNNQSADDERAVDDDTSDAVQCDAMDCDAATVESNHLGENTELSIVVECHNNNSNDMQEYITEGASNGQECITEGESIESEKFESVSDGATNSCDANINNSSAVTNSCGADGYSCSVILTDQHLNESQSGVTESDYLMTGQSNVTCSSLTEQMTHTDAGVDSSIKLQSLQHNNDWKTQSKDTDISNSKSATSNQILKSGVSNDSAAPEQESLELVNTNVVMNSTLSDSPEKSSVIGTNSSVTVTTDSVALEVTQALILQSDSAANKSLTEPTSVTEQETIINNDHHQTDDVTDTTRDQSVVPMETSGGAACDDPEPDSWDALFDEKGEALDPSLMAELTIAVGKDVEVTKTKYDYRDFKPRDPDIDYTEYAHLIEIYDFPKEFVTRDLVMAFKDYESRGFDIKWVDDTHAIGVFASPIAAQSALQLKHPMFKVRPLDQAMRATKVKAKKTAEFLQPYKPRPETVASVVRNMIAGALGIQSKVSREVRDEERRKLKEAKDRKREMRKQKDETWDGRIGKCAMDDV